MSEAVSAGLHSGGRRSSASSRDRPPASRTSLPIWCLLLRRSRAPFPASSTIPARERTGPPLPSRPESAGGVGLAGGRVPVRGPGSPGGLRGSRLQLRRLRGQRQAPLRSFASVPQRSWHAKMVPASEYLKLEDEEAADKVPTADGRWREHPPSRGRDAQHHLGRAALPRRPGAACRSSPGSATPMPWRSWSGEEDLEEEKKREIARSRARSRSRPLSSPPPRRPPSSQPRKSRKRRSEGPDRRAFIETPRCNACDECTKKNQDVRLQREQAGLHQGHQRGSFRDLVERPSSARWRSSIPASRAIRASRIWKS